MRNLFEQQPNRTTRKLKRAWPSVSIVLVCSACFYWSEITLLEKANSPTPIYAAIHSEDSAQIFEDNALFAGLSSFTEVEDVELNRPLEKELSTDEVSQQFNQALLASQQNDIALAISIYEGILKAKPNHQMAAINLALMLQRQQEWYVSLKALKNALEIAGGSRKGKIHALMGKAYQHLDQHGKAIQHYKKSIEYRPSHVNTWRQLANASGLEKQPYADVVSLYNKAIALEKTNPTGYIEKAQYQFHRLDFEGVIETLTPTDHILLSQKQLTQKNTLVMLSLLERNQTTKIRIQLLTQSSSTNPKHEIFAKALSFLTNKRHTSAIEILEKQTKNAMEHHEMSLGLLRSYAYQKSGDLEKSRSALLTIHPSNENEDLLKYKLALLLTKTNTEASTREAKSSLESILSNTLYQADIARELSILSSRLGQATQALGYAELALSHGRDSRRFSYQRIQVERQFGSLDKAITLSEKLAKRFPKSRSVLRQWARSLSESGHTQEAIEKYRLLTKNNQRKSDLKALAKLLKTSRQIDASIQVLETLLAKYSNDIEARYLFAENLCDIGKVTECETQARTILRLDKQHLRAKDLIARIAPENTHG